ncbi:hypothetical protein P280DRAFT_530140 [Massarina eburnea CBS 473.64]|uniref:Uncharacterized protein n=1 Tax=Massarina eburnea CBS 473.64 TaxID=1395130 RepID=A0A6A6RUV7_9PLEO|nr:hypothetical protein P280DRAFT_530140 [Massarina eburnea CBS 473.64]
MDSRSHTPDAVVNWLRDVRIVDSDSDAQQLSQHHDLGQADKTTPSTPLSRETMPHSYDEVSPTDTAFSSTNKVFDSPVRPLHFSSSPRSSSLVRKYDYDSNTNDYDYGSGYAETVASSLSHEEHAHSDAEDDGDGEETCVPQSETGREDPDTIVLAARKAEDGEDCAYNSDIEDRVSVSHGSHIPKDDETHLTRQTPKLATSALNTNNTTNNNIPIITLLTTPTAAVCPWSSYPPWPTPPPTPHLIFLQSCYQCILADLPCSRTPPSCTRCIRNGCADECLLQRRMLSWELRDGYEGLLGGVPVLVKLEGTDERAWERKVRLGIMLVERWRESAARRNWVLPRWWWGEGGRRDGGVGSVAVEGFGGWHLGAGMGRVRFEEVRLGAF